MHRGRCWNEPHVRGRVTRCVGLARHAHGFMAFELKIVPKTPKFPFFMLFRLFLGFRIHLLSYVCHVNLINSGFGVHYFSVVWLIKLCFVLVLYCAWVVLHHPQPITLSFHNLFVVVQPHLIENAPRICRLHLKRKGNLINHFIVFQVNLHINRLLVLI